MTKIEQVKSWLLSRVGNPYLMGGTGQFCTVSYRKARAAQYPGSAAKIKNNCPRMRGDASTCKGCRYYDEAAQNGKRAYDCAQLTRWAMDSIGISLVSGATSQWRKTPWESLGEIGTIPRDKFCLVFRDDGNNVMGHVGAYMGDGSVIHAKGHDYGVVREGLEAYGRFTHWAIPAGLYNAENAPAQPGKAAEFEVTGTRLALRQGMTTQSPVIDRMERGTVISGTPVNSDWVKIEYNGKTGYSMAQYLRSTEPQEPADDSPDDAPDSPAAGLDDVTLTLPRKTAEALINALTAGLDGG